MKKNYKYMILLLLILIMETNTADFQNSMNDTTENINISTFGASSIKDKTEL